MHEWLLQARSRLAGSVGEADAAYDLTEDEVGQLLELARVAAHESGQRTNAPLICYLVGLARGRHPERSVGELVEGVTGNRRESR